MRKLSVRWALVVATALVTTACSADDADVAPTPTTMMSALATVPATMQTLTFVDLASAKTRWGVADLTPAAFTDPAQAKALDTYLTKVDDEGLGTSIDNYASVMADWGWNALSVDWEISEVARQGPPTYFLKLTDSLDMNVVVSSLTDNGFVQSSGGDGVLRFDRSATDNAAARGQAAALFFGGVFVYPAKHLLVATADRGFALPDMTTSLAAHPVVTALLADSPTPTFAALSMGGDACIDAAGVPNKLASPQARAEQLRKLGTLRPIVGSAVMASAASATVVTKYPTADDATEDQPARQALLTGNSPATGDKYSTYFTGTVTADGDQLTYQLQLNRPRWLLQSFSLGDTPWAFCT